jgi:hypothetical protein
MGCRYLVDICRDLGVAPGQMDRANWGQLQRAVIEYGSNLVTLIYSPDRLKISEDPASCTDLGPVPIGTSGQPIIAFPPWPALPAQPPPPLRK